MEQSLKNVSVNLGGMQHRCFPLLLLNLRNSAEGPHPALAGWARHLPVPSPTPGLGLLGVGGRASPCLRPKSQGRSPCVLLSSAASRSGRCGANSG